CDRPRAFFCQAEDGIRDFHVTGVQTCAFRSQRERVATYDFITDMYKYSGAADLVISRCSATTMSELAVQGKAVVIVPSPYLAGEIGRASCRERVWPGVGALAYRRCRSGARQG